MPPSVPPQTPNLTIKRASEFYVERIPVAGGAELITLLRRQENAPDMPIVSVLRDTLGDSNPENDRLSKVWVLTYVRPSIWQKTLAWIPFAHFRAGGKGDPSKPPAVALDLAAADRAAWDNLLWYAVQDLLLDARGATVRAPTRTWRINRSDHKNAQIYRALSVLSEADPDPAAAAFTPAEKEQLEARMMLAGKIMGGFVADASLGRVHRKAVNENEIARGHNWEFLRQRAEAEGLYFEPVEFGDASEPFALLWVARSDAASSDVRRPFNPQFLDISSPWTDPRLKRWEGYTATWHFDAEGRRQESGAGTFRTEEMIPLALYSLDHPRAPLLLVDFRSDRKAQRRELARASLRDLAIQIFGYSKFANWYYFAGQSAWFFVTGRHGAAVDRSARLRAYAQLRTLLWLDDRLDPALRAEIYRRERHLALNPLESDFTADAVVARAQYESLLRWAKSPSGLPARLETARRSELLPLFHSRRQQVLFRIGSVFTLGAWNHRERWTDDSVAKLDVRRRVTLYQHALATAVSSSPRLDVSADLAQIRGMVRFLGEHTDADGGERSASPSLIARVFQQTADDETRLECVRSLRGVNTALARHQLEILAKQIALLEAKGTIVSESRQAGE